MVKPGTEILGMRLDYEYMYTIYMHSQQLSHKDMGNAQDSIMCTFTHFLTNTGFSLGPVSSSESEYSSYSED